MKIKTINKIITNKVNEWLESIEDKKLKYEIRKKDNLRKNLKRDDKVSSNLERLGGIDE